MYDFKQEQKRLEEYAKTHDIQEINSEDLMKLFERPYTIGAIASAFHLTSSEFRKVRKKKNVSNMYLERCIRNLDTILYYIDTNYEALSEMQRNKIVLMLVFTFSGVYPNDEFYKKALSKLDFSKQAVLEDIKRREIDIDYRLHSLQDILIHIDQLVKSDMEKQCDIIIQDENEIVKYHVVMSTEKYEISSPKTHKNHKAVRMNQKKANDAKVKSGKIGEKIVLEFEKERLKNSGQSHLINDVRLVAQIDEEYTFDGLGYDLISFNDVGEKICIEVKTNHGKRDKPFFISEKEMEIINGIREEHDCKYCFIYYVLINQNEVTIKKIDYQDFKTYKLKPVLYKIEETGSESYEL